MKQCEKCGETVDEAKAFCPGCGNAFVKEQQRGEASKFDSLDNTVQLGQTMYNAMLSDMGLNISKPSAATSEKRIEVLAPIETPLKSPETTPENAKPSGNIKWFILAGILAMLIFLFLVAVVLGVMYWSRTR